MDKFLQNANAILPKKACKKIIICLKVAKKIAIQFLAIQRTKNQEELMKSLLNAFFGISNCRTCST